MILKELINPNSTILNDTQKYVLLIAFRSPTPELSYANTNNAENLVAGKKMLINLGAISQYGNTAEVTDKGKEMLIYHNLIDDMGKLTEEGEALISEYEDITRNYKSQEAFESYEFLQSLL